MLVFVLVLLVIAAAFFFAYRKPAPDPPAKVLTRTDGPVANHPAYEIRDVTGHLTHPSTGQGVFVVRGTVANVGKGPSGGIRIQAALLGADNQAITQGETFAGNTIDESLLPHMYRVRIEEFLGLRYGEGNVNRDIPPGGSLPFMVVFFAPPSGVESFSVKAMDAEKDGNALPSDGHVEGMHSSVPVTIPLN